MNIYPPIRRAMIGLAAAVVSATLLLVPTSLARAQVVDLVCPGYSTSTYQPGLRNTPK